MNIDPEKIYKEKHNFLVNTGTLKNFELRENHIDVQFDKDLETLESDETMKKMRFDVDLKKAVWSEINNLKNNKA